MEVKICTWKTCSWKFSKYILTRLENDTSFYNWKDVKVEETACMGECKKAPNVKIQNELHNYASPAKTSEITCKKVAERKKQQENNSKSKKKK